MDKTRLYAVLDISEPEEFTYYENIAALFEEEEIIEENLIHNLLHEIDRDVFVELSGNYFDEFLNRIPDEESDLYLTVDNIKRTFAGSVEPEQLAEAVLQFRKWYVIDTPVVDRNTGNEWNVRDARYEISAANLLGESVDFDFSRALEYDLEGYDVLLSDIIGDEDL